MAGLLQPEDYAVYRAVLLQRFNNDRRERFVINRDLEASALRLRGEQTINSKILHWRLKLKGLEAVTAGDFVRKNAGPLCMESTLELPLPYVLLTEAESSEIWNRVDKQSSRGQPMDGWKVFRDRYPAAFGVVSFSGVGFNEQKTQALVEMGVQADWLAGHGGLTLLSRDGAEWTIGSELTLWVS